MKKMILFILATALFTGVYFSCLPSSAASWQVVVCGKMSSVTTTFSRYAYTVNENSYIQVNNNNTFTVVNATALGYSQYKSSFNTLQDAFEYEPSYYTYSGSASYTFHGDTVYIGTIRIVGSSDKLLSAEEYNNIINPPPEEDSWWEILWDTVSDYFENPIPGGWITNLINRLKDDENEDSLVDNVTLEAPTVAPTPTNIPYSTIIVPNTDIIPGTTVNEIQYIYNVSGTPIITQSPPPNSGGEGGSGNGGGEYHPKGGDPYSIPSLDWLTSAKLGDTSYNGIDSLSNGMDSINEVGSEYNDGMSTVQDATGVLPSNWLLLIGIAAAIPLIAGIISRFLS